MNIQKSMQAIMMTCAKLLQHWFGPDDDATLHELLRSLRDQCNVALGDCPPELCAQPELLELMRKVWALGSARPEPWIKSLIPQIEEAIARAEGKKS